MFSLLIEFFPIIWMVLKITIPLVFLLNANYLNASKRTIFNNITIKTK